GVQPLHRADARDLLVLGEVDARHAALAEQAQQAVGAQLLDGGAARGRGRARRLGGAARRLQAPTLRRREALLVDERRAVDGAHARGPRIGPLAARADARSRRHQPTRTSISPALSSSRTSPPGCSAKTSNAAFSRCRVRMAARPRAPVSRLMLSPTT